MFMTEAQKYNLKRARKAAAEIKGAKQRLTGVAEDPSLDLGDGEIDLGDLIEILDDAEARAFAIVRNLERIWA